MRRSRVDWQQPFPLSHVTREDLVAVGCTRWEAAKFTDEQMALIASRMGDIYADTGYHEDMLNAIEYVHQVLPIRNVTGERV